MRHLDANQSSNNTDPGRASVSVQEPSEGLRIVYPRWRLMPAGNFLLSTHVAMMACLWNSQRHDCLDTSNCGSLATCAGSILKLPSRGDYAVLSRKANGRVRAFPGDFHG